MYFPAFTLFPGLSFPYPNSVELPHEQAFSAYLETKTAEGMLRGFHCDLATEEWAMLESANIPHLSHWCRILAKNPSIKVSVSSDEWAEDFSWSVSKESVLSLMQQAGKAVLPTLLTDNVPEFCPRYFSNLKANMQTAVFASSTLEQIAQLYENHKGPLPASMRKNKPLKFGRLPKAVYCAKTNRTIEANTFVYSFPLTQSFAFSTFCSSIHFEDYTKKTSLNLEDPKVMKWFSKDELSQIS